MNRTSLILLVPAILWMTDAFAQASFTPLSPAESRAIDRADTQRFRIMALDGSKPRTEWELSLGGTYTRGEGDIRESSGDVALTATLPGGTVFLMASGYVRSRGDGETARGAGDVILKVIHPLGAAGGGNFLGSIGVIVPTGTEVSSGHSTQSAAVYYAHSLGESLSGLFVLQGAHTNIPLPPSLSRTSYSFTSKITGSPAESTKAWLRYSAAHRDGAKTKQEIAAAWEHALTPSRGVSLAVTRGLTSGARATSVEASFSWAF